MPRQSPKPSKPGAVASKLPYYSVHEMPQSRNWMISIHDDGGSSPIAAAYLEKDAEAIKTALNSHAAIVQALQDLLREDKDPSRDESARLRWDMAIRSGYAALKLAVQDGKEG